MSTESLSGVSSSFSLSNTNQGNTNNLDSGSGSGITDKASFGAAVVTGTMDALNSGGSHNADMAQAYDFNKTVLGGHAASLGAVTDINI
ncbi:MAG: hypothetical protein P4L39_09520 [Humidesulfovibrio sp.]|nr:hypothetical protein [Humidesulfovibrio sp.]